MPIFRSKFCPVKCPARKKLPFHPNTLEQREFKEPLKIQLGNLEAVFENGDWKPGKPMSPPVAKGNLSKNASGDAFQIYNENMDLKEFSKNLKEENNLLRIKVEILLDMLTEETYGGSKEIHHTK